MTPRDIIAADLTSARAENERLKAALGQIARMAMFPDDKANRMTLLAAIEIARKAVEGREGLG